MNVRSGQMTNSSIFRMVLILTVLVDCLFYNLCGTSTIQNSNQYTKIAQGAPSSSYLPLKVNPAGVIPVIFASSITAAPAAFSKLLALWVTMLDG